MKLTGSCCVQRRRKKREKREKKDKFLSTTAENGAESAFCEQKAGAERQDFDGRIGAETSVFGADSGKD